MQVSIGTIQKPLVGSSFLVAATLSSHVELCHAIETLAERLEFGDRLDQEQATLINKVIAQRDKDDKYTENINLDVTTEAGSHDVSLYASFGIWRLGCYGASRQYGHEIADAVNEYLSQFTGDTVPFF